VKKEEHLPCKKENPALSLVTTQKATPNIKHLQNLNETSFEYYGKGKTIPIQACRAPEGSRRMRLPDVTTVVI